MKFRHQAACAAALFVLAAGAQAKVIISGTYPSNCAFSRATAFVPLTTTGGWISDIALVIHQ
jgi:hypothetical protein